MGIRWPGYGWSLNFKCYEYVVNVVASANGQYIIGSIRGCIAEAIDAFNAELPDGDLPACQISPSSRSFSVLCQDR